MKEEAETCSKLPPKIMGGGGVSGGGGGLAVTMAPAATTTHHTSSSMTMSAAAAYSGIGGSSTPCKQPSDEILTSLLRMNNFDSISSIKDESLDINLSACVTITADASGMIGGNSLSSSDFWRVLDESAQTPQLDVSGGSTASGSNTSGTASSSKDLMAPSPNSSLGSYLITSDKTDLGSIVVKKEQTDFSGTFLKPSSGITFSPLKRCIKMVSTESPLLKDKSPTRLMKMETDSGTASTGPSAPLVIIQQFPKPTIELPKINGTQSPSLDVVIKKEVVMSQSPPRFTSDSTASANKVEVLAKIIAEPVYKCTDCDATLQGSQELASHAGHRIIYKCMECEKEFDSEPSLKKHLKTHRPMDARKDAWKKCPDCGKCLKLGSMWMHRKIHTENKKYGCEICGQKFVQKINLTHHQRIHTSEKPYECSECQKRFQERSHLQRHQKYHAQTRSYRCEKCGKMYKTERCLKVHNLVHLEQRPFACTVCDKSFISNSKLKQHSNIHTGERPFKCNYCPRDFTNFPNWLKHTRRRHKVDHKTGEILENIPSYCSKKSTRTPKEKKATGADAKTPANAANAANASTTPLMNQKPLQANGVMGSDLNKMDTFQPVAVSTATSKTVNNIIASVAGSSPTVTAKSGGMANGPPPLTKVPAKRKKKVPASAAATPVVIKTEVETLHKNFILTSAPQNSQQQRVNMPTTNGGVGPPPLALVFNTKSLNVATMATTATTATLLTSQASAQAIKPPLKTDKCKRERKQPMPKQVQQVPPPLIIKKEFIEPKPDLSIPASTQESQQLHQPSRLQQSQSQQQTKAPFPDLHCLSITSAEELIMEQALEMEESGLYKAQSTSTRRVDFADTDNAISSEAMADLHFKIKEEQHDMELKLKTEEIDSIKKSICSSLESSPYSSPASLDFAPSSSLSNDYNVNNFYLPPFTITNNQIIATNASISNVVKMENNTQTSAASTNGSSNHRVQVPQLVATNLSVPKLVQISQSNQRQLKANLTPARNHNNNSNNVSAASDNSSSSFINQLYLPLTMNASPVLVKSHQTLPSVDTLLFSHSKLGIFNNRNLPKQATTAQHNLS